MSPDPLSRCLSAVVGLITALLLGACSQSPTPSPGDPSALVPPAAFAAVVADPATFVLNVHTPDEGALPGTEATIAFDQLRDRADELPANRAAPIAIYCRSGRMSTLAAVTLGDLGYTDVTELDGGMEAWQDDGRRLLAPGSTYSESG